MPDTHRGAAADVSSVELEGRAHQEPVVAAVELLLGDLALGEARLEDLPGVLLRQAALCGGEPSIVQPRDADAGGADAEHRADDGDG